MSAKSDLSIPRNLIPTARPPGAGTSVSCLEATEGSESAQAGGQNRTPVAPLDRGHSVGGEGLAVSAVALKLV